MYVVFTEVDGERWFYGVYERDRANEVAADLGKEVCPLAEAEDWGVKNLPRR